MQHTNNEKKTKILTLLEMFPFPETPYAAENLHDVSKKFNLKSSWLKCKMSNPILKSVLIAEYVEACSCPDVSSLGSTPIMGLDRCVIC